MQSRSRGNGVRFVAVLVLAAAALSGGATAQAASVEGELGERPGATGCSRDDGAFPCADAKRLVNPNAMVLSPDGTSAYVVSDNAVAVFDRGPDGTLTQKAGSAACVSDDAAEGCADANVLDVPLSAAISPDGKSLYVAAYESNSVTVFDRAPDGTLTQKAGPEGCVAEAGSGGCGEASGLDVPLSVAISPDGESVYATAFQSDAVTVFDRGEDGTLTQKAGEDGCLSKTGAGGCTAVASLDGPRAVAFSPDGEHAYVTSNQNGSLTLLDRDAEGVLTPRAGAAGCIAESAADGCADGYGLESATTPVPSADGRSVYVVSSYDVAILDRAADGSLSQRPEKAGCISGEATNAPPECMRVTGVTGVGSLALSPDERFVYTASPLSGSVAVFRRGADGGLSQLPGGAACVAEMGDSPYFGGRLCADSTSLEGAAVVQVSPDGRQAYVLGRESSSVRTFDRLPDDAQPPAIAVSRPAEGQRFAQGAAVTPEYTCDDGDPAGSSGLLACTGPASLDTASPGEKTLVITASDRGRNTATRTVRYVVDPAPRVDPPGIDPLRPDTTAPAIRVPGANRRLTATRSGVVRFRLGELPEAVTGSVALKTARKLRSGRRSRRARILAFGRRSFEGAQGQAPTVRIRLGRAARRTLAARRKLRIVARITAVDAAGNRAVRTYRFTLRAPAR